LDGAGGEGGIKGDGEVGVPAETGTRGARERRGGVMVPDRIGVVVPPAVGWV
jgi:hypothetical protein